MTVRVDTLEDMARVFHSLGDRTRLGIMTLLTEGEMNVTTICNELKLPQSTVSHHLGLLRIGGLVRVRRAGKQVFYSHANLSEHRLGRRAELVASGGNAARLGPAELILLTK